MAEVQNHQHHQPTCSTSPTAAVCYEAPRLTHLQSTEMMNAPSPQRMHALNNGVHHQSYYPIHPATGLPAVSMNEQVNGKNLFVCNYHGESVVSVISPYLLVIRIFRLPYNA